MKYLSKISVEELRSKYKYLVGWAPSELEFSRRYNPFKYKLDYMIDGKGGLPGK